MWDVPTDAGLSQGVGVGADFVSIERGLVDLAFKTAQHHFRTKPSMGDVIVVHVAESWRC